MPRKRTAGPAFEAIEAQAFRRHGLRPRTCRLELEEPRLSLRAVEAGSGEPLLLLHGISLSPAHWAPMMARLAGARCIALDMPGHGESDGADFRGVDLRRWHTDLLGGCLDGLGLDSAHIVGHSYGGMFGLWMALDAPERVRSVISIGTPSIALGARPDLLFRAPAWPAFGPLMLRSPMPRFVQRTVLAHALGRPAIDAAGPDLLRVAYLATRRQGFATTASTYLREQFRGMHAAPPRYELGDDELARIRTPVLFVWGDRDSRYQPIEDGARKASLIPQARFETVFGGHAPWLDDPEPCAELVADFVNCRPDDEAQVVRRFHELQGAFYTGGPLEPLMDLLADDVCWHVPGRSPIAGDHRGRPAVLAYFRRRRDLAAATFRLQVRDVVASGDLVFQRVDGTVSRAGTSRSWETVGVLRVSDGRIRECWLLPLDQDLFDEIWAGGP
jgi:pimeloyl-ACP methyl ester carboxylesterase/ketosteroid isomerase-like protein